MGRGRALTVSVSLGRARPYLGWMRHLALLVLAVLSAAAPTAAAQQTNAPPGNSGLDQYLESVPSDSGATPSRGVAGSKPGKVPGAVTRTLRDRGASGAELQRLIARTVPQPRGTETRRAVKDVSRGHAGTASAGGGPVRATIAAATGSGGGAGLWLRLLVAALLVGAAGAVVLRRVRSRPS